MGFARERVVPPLGKGAWVRYGGLGFAVGTFLATTLPWLADFLMMQAATLSDRSMIAVEVINAVMAGLLVIPLLLLVRVTQRWSPILAFAGWYAAAFSFFSGAKGVLALPDGGADTSAWHMLEFFQRVGLLVAVALLAAIVLRVLCRLLIVRLIEQGPDDCAWCGYTRGSAAITRCPECGREAAASRYRLHTFVMSVASLARRWRILGVAACALLMAFSIQPLLARTIPAMGFYRRFPRAVRVPTIGDELTVWIAEPSDRQRGLAVRYRLAEGSHPGGMSVEIAAWNGSVLSMGSRLVIARLNSAQRTFVLEHELPGKLIDRLYARADEINWTAQSTTLGEEAVDPVSCFPE